MACRNLLLQIMLLGATISFTLAQSVPGGTANSKPANSEVQALLNRVRNEVDEELGFTSSKFELISYKTQVVAGTNYFAKIDIGDALIHARVFRNLKGEVSLHSLQYPKTHEDEIIYF